MHKPRKLFPFQTGDTDSDEDEVDKKRVKYSKILDEEDDFWPEENFPSPK
jgi:hypothetical protein